MGIRGIIQAGTYNRYVKGDRKTRYDRDKIITIGSYGKLHDHKQLKSHEFAAFEKQLFAKQKRAGRNDKINILILILGTALLLWLVFVLLVQFFENSYRPLVL